MSLIVIINNYIRIILELPKSLWLSVPAGACAEQLTFPSHLGVTVTDIDLSLLLAMWL